MGFVDKLKNLFTEEDEEEVEEIPVKKEVIHVDIPAPVKPKEEEKPVVPEKEEEKFKFPVYFDDKDFDELKPAPAPKKVEPKREMRETRTKEPYGGKKPYQGNIGKPTTAVGTKKKNFAPSPIISPVYGVLDKNYHKEDITNKQEEEVKVTPIIAHTNSKVTIDDVRNKAFGTLEDDLETTLFGKNSILFNEKEEKKETEDFFDDLGFGLDEEIEQELPKDETALHGEDITLEDVDQIASISNEDENHEELQEDDLFDLIDSMYEKREDK